MKLHFLSHKVISNKSTELAFVNHKPSSIHIKRDGKVISVSFKSDSRVQSPSNLFSDVSDETIKQFHIENLPIPPDTSNPTGNSNKTNDEELTSIGGSSLSSEDFHFDQSLNLTLGDYTINLQNTDEISLNLTLNDLIDKINNESSSSESNESSFSQGETTSDSDASIEKSIASIALTGPLSFIGDLHLNESIFQWYHLASKFPKSEKSISQLLCKYASCHIENKPTFDKLIKEWTKLFENDQDMARFILDETYDLIQATFPPCLKGILNLIGYINAYKEQEKKLEEIIQSEFETESKKSEHQKVLNVVKELTDFQKDKTQERIQSTIASMQALYKNLSDKDKPESKIEFFKQLDTEKPSPFQEYTDLTRAQLVAAGNFKASFSADSSSETTEMPLTYYDPRKASIISWIYEGLK
ncbi:MAG: hypothetical protein VW397_02335, partial [Candidatus Margulisiibacteriota bacterium]